MQIWRNLKKKHCQINLGLHKMPMEKVLGVMWQPEKYTLKIKAVEKKLSTTKREVLSFMSTIFDPLGFVTPAVFKQN